MPRLDSDTSGVRPSSSVDRRLRARPTAPCRSAAISDSFRPATSGSTGSCTPWRVATARPTSDDPYRARLRPSARTSRSVTVTRTPPAPIWPASRSVTPSAAMSRATAKCGISDQDRETWRAIGARPELACGSAGEDPAAAGDAACSARAARRRWRGLVRCGVRPGGASRDGPSSAVAAGGGAAAGTGAAVSATVVPAAAGGPDGAGSLSRSASTTVTVAPTATDSPAATRCAPRWPAAEAEISSTDLSVSTSAIASPASTASPGSLSQVRSTASDMAMPRAGTKISSTWSRLPSILARTGQREVVWRRRPRRSRRVLPTPGPGTG